MYIEYQARGIVWIGLLLEILYRGKSSDLQAMCLEQALNAPQEAGVVINYVYRPRHLLSRSGFAAHHLEMTAAIRLGI